MHTTTNTETPKSVAQEFVDRHGAWHVFQAFIVQLKRLPLHEQRLFIGQFRQFHRWTEDAPGDGDPAAFVEFNGLPGVLIAIEQVLERAPEIERRDWVRAVKEKADAALI